MAMEFHWLLLVSIFLVALLYASVGHGGASGYLAVLSFSSIPSAQMAGSALVLNLFVAASALLNFAKAGCFSWGLAWPFVLASVPMAWIGGGLEVPPRAYAWLLGIVLGAAAWRLWMELPVGSPLPGRPRPAIALPAGAAIGLLSGIVGIGGGIFLSPLLLLRRWADPKRAAAASAFFILVNSAAGLLGRAGRGSPIAGGFLELIPAALLGGMVGSRMGANRFSGLALRRVLAAALMIAALKAVGR